MTIHDDLVSNYEAAKRLLERIHAEWEATGYALTTLGGATGRSEVAHPLVTMYQTQLNQVDRLAKAIEAKHRGQDPVAKIQAGIGKAPSALRAVPDKDAKTA